MPKNKLSGGTIAGVTVPFVTLTNVVDRMDGTLRAILFNKVDSKIDCGSYASLIGDISLSAFIKPLSLGENNIGTIINNTKFIVALDATTNRISVSSEGTTKVYSANNAITFGKWHHLSVIRKSDGKASIYINGVLSGTADQSSGTPVVGSNIIIGNNTGQTATWDGKLSNIKLFQGIISQTELTQLYTSQKSKFNL